MDDDDLIEAPAEYRSGGMAAKSRFGFSGARKAPSEFEQRRSLTNDAWKREMDANNLAIKNEARIVARQNAEVAAVKAQAELAQKAYEQRMEIEGLGQTAGILKELSALDYKDPDAPAKRTAIASKYALATKNPLVQQAIADHDDLYKTHFGNQRQDVLREQTEKVATAAGLKPQQATVDMGQSSVQMGNKEELAEQKLTAKEQATLAKNKALKIGYEKELAGIRDQEKADTHKTFENDPEHQKRKIKAEANLAAVSSLVDEFEPPVANVVQAGATQTALDLEALKAERAKYKPGDTFTVGGRTFRVK